jgi:hypothetical protein
MPKMVPDPFPPPFSKIEREMINQLKKRRKFTVPVRVKTKDYSYFPLAKGGPSG